MKDYIDRIQVSCEVKMVKNLLQFKFSLQLYKFDTEEEVFRRANQTELGLAAGIFTNDFHFCLNLPEKKVTTSPQKFSCFLISSYGPLLNGSFYLCLP